MPNTSEKGENSCRASICPVIDQLLLDLGPCSAHSSKRGTKSDPSKSETDRRGVATWHCAFPVVLFPDAAVYCLNFNTRLLKIKFKRRQEQRASRLGLALSQFQRAQEDSSECTLQGKKKKKKKITCLKKKV